MEGIMALLIVYAVAVLAMIVFAILDPDRLMAYLFFFLIGLFGTWRYYLRWRRTGAGRLSRTRP
jgi:hypothetical protein